MSKIIPLIKEPHPSHYNGLPFLTLLEYQNKQMITVVDNYQPHVLSAYVMDLCEVEGLNQIGFLMFVNIWWERELYNTIPLSFYLSKCNATESTHKILRSFPTEYITRAIGPVFQFDMDSQHSIKRRRRRDVSSITVNNQPK